jgi:two-component system sensor histidine kinase BaeS
MQMSLALVLPSRDAPVQRFTSASGIPADDIPRLFTRFYRAGNGVGKVAGTGLGLASVRQVVEGHGGTVAAESTLGDGSTFTLRLPLESEG